MKLLLAAIILVIAFYCGVIAKGPVKAGPTLGDLRRQLLAMIDNKKQRGLLMEFCTKEFSCENINFVIDATKALGSKNFRADAAAVVAKYAINSPNTINISSKTRDMFEGIPQTNDESAARNAMQTAREEIIKLITIDTLPRFNQEQRKAKPQKEGLKLNLFGNPGKAPKGGNVYDRSVAMVVGKKKQGRK